MEVFIIIVFAFLTLANLGYLVFLVRNNKGSADSNNQNLENYYKLDAKVETLKYTVLVILAVAAFFGIDKFTKLSDDLAKVEAIETKFDDLSSKYAQLNSNHDNLQNSYQNLYERYEKISDKYNQYDREFNRFEYRIREASRRIPENNLKVLAEMLIKYQVEVEAKKNQFDFMASSKPISTLKKLSSFLINMGYTQSEIEDFQKEIVSELELKDEM